VLRDIFPNPFQPSMHLESDWLRWRNGAVVEAAQACYARGECEDLSHLARTLEQAGCNNEDILAHCRASSGHVRGCWALDLLLQKRDLPGFEKGFLRFPRSTGTALQERRTPRFLQRDRPASALLARA
jgi:hypothetical protein